MSGQPIFSTTQSETKSWDSPFEDLLTQTLETTMPTSLATEVQKPNTMIGTPAQDVQASPVIQQNYADTCAIKCQELILEQFSGQDIAEETLVQEAQQHGWYQPGAGTSPADVGNLLELHGIPVNRYDHANIFNLTSELAQGHKVIIGVDSGELWMDDPARERLEDETGINLADHAVVVSGIDTSDPANPQVILTDPGSGQAMATYPMSEFLDAWSDSDFFMVATQEPAPAHLPEMANFNYATGYAPGFSATQLAPYENNPDALIDYLSTDEVSHDLHSQNIEPATFDDHTHSDVCTHVSTIEHEINQLEVELAQEEARHHVAPNTFSNPHLD
jgi:hypothetical protein